MILFVGFLTGMVSGHCFLKAGMFMDDDGEKVNLYGILGLLALVASMVLSACWGASLA